MKTPNRGFTLIELLVVISITALLSSVILAALQGARSKGRDAARQEEIWQINNAIQLYVSNHGHPPDLHGTCPFTQNNNDSDPTVITKCVADSFDPSPNTNWNELQEDLADYITLPSDPCGSACPNGTSGYVYVTPLAYEFACTFSDSGCYGQAPSSFVDSYQMYTTPENGPMFGDKSFGNFITRNTGNFVLRTLVNSLQTDSANAGGCHIGTNHGSLQSQSFPCNYTILGIDLGQPSSWSFNNWDGNYPSGYGSATGPGIKQATYIDVEPDAASIPSEYIFDVKFSSP